MDSTSGDNSPAVLTGKQSDGKKKWGKKSQGTNNPTVGATMTKEESKTGSWPMISTGLGYTRNLSFFKIHLWRYLILCVDVYDVIQLSLRRNELVVMPLKKFTYYMIMALARRVYDLVAGFGDIATDQSLHAPIPSNTLQIPRPLYCFMACIGDLRVADLNLNIRPLLTIDSVKALVYCANEILELGGTEDENRAAILGYNLCTQLVNDAEALGIQTMQYFLTRFFEIDCTADTDIGLRNFIRNCYAIRGVTITQNQATAILVLFTGWIAEPPFRQDGSFITPAGFELLNIGANQQILERMRGLHKCSVIYDCIASLDRDWSTEKTLRITPKEIEVFDRIRQVYSCSNGIQSSINGSPCQLMTEERLQSGAFVMSSVLPASGTHLGMGVICKFNPAGDTPIESMGYTTILQADEPDTIVSQWIASNKIANRPK